MSNFTLPLSQRQEQFSVAWIQAISSVAGYSVENIRVDNDSIDALITQKGDGNSYPQLESVGVQLKCSYKHVPNKINCLINFPLKIKNYNDLRRDKIMNPRILVVLHVPRENHAWLNHENDKIILQHCAYWASLRKMPATKNTTTVTIKIPTSQVFDTDYIKKLMDLVAKGKHPRRLM